MYCNNCLTLAFSPSNHKCINCPRICKIRQEKWCAYCSSIKKICAVCGKSIIVNNSNNESAKTKIQRIHPFFKGNGGCKKCGQ